MDLTIPKSLKSEHDELHMTLAKAMRLGGKVGASAKTVVKILHPHSS